MIHAATSERLRRAADLDPTDTVAQLAAARDEERRNGADAVARRLLIAEAERAREELRALLSRANGRARTRTLSVADVLDLVETALEEAEEHGDGWDATESSNPPGAYRYKWQETHAVAYCHGGRVAIAVARCNETPSGTHPAFRYHCRALRNAASSESPITESLRASGRRLLEEPAGSFWRDHFDDPASRVIVVDVDVARELVLAANP